MHQLGAGGGRDVAGAFARQGRVEQAAARPVGLEQRVAHRRRVGVRLVELDPDRRSAADVAQRRQAVVGPRRQLAGAVPVAVVAAGHDVHRADVAIPRHPDVPLHVAVEGEQLAVQVEGVVVGIAEGAGDDGEALRRRVDAMDGAVGADFGARPEAAAVLHHREELRLTAAGERRSRIDLPFVDEERVVAGHHRQGAVRATPQRVDAVLLDRVDERRDQRRALGDAVAVGVGHLVEARLLRRRRLPLRHGGIARAIQGRPVVPQALAILDAGADDHLALEEAVAIGVDEPSGMVELLRDDQPALAVERHRDVGVGLPGRHRALDGEVRQRSEAARFAPRGERVERRPPGWRGLDWRGPGWRWLRQRRWLGERLRGGPDDEQRRQAQAPSRYTSHSSPNRRPRRLARPRPVRTSGGPPAALVAPATPTGSVRTSVDPRSCQAGAGSSATVR